MKHYDTVAIVGPGLIGGSIGLGLLRRRLARWVVGIGRRASSLRKARRLGAVSTTTTNLARGVADAELVVVCTPVEKIVGHVCAAADASPPGAVITDAGSTKAAIVAALDAALARDAAFVGSHPLAGSEKTGPEYATADLFVGRTAVVTPTRRTRPAALEAVAALWSSLGAAVVQMTPKAHDAAVARTSHLPHLVASALAGAARRRDLPLVSTGWLDTTRVAGGNVELWRQIFAENRDHVLKSLAEFEKRLASFRAAIERADGAQLIRLLKTGKENRDTVGS